ncbi:MAG TPA: lipid II flippase MurJ [Armatimonadota bacterium]|nr:lipid II flippase MurJ [Armatimonadota bacterium]
MSDESVDTTDEQQPEPEKDSSDGRRMTLAALVVTGFLLLSKFAGLAKEMLLTRYFGASAATDAFKVIYNSFIFLVYTKIEKLERPCYLPLFVKRKDEDGEEAAWEFGSVVMVIHFLVLVVIAALAVFFAPSIIRTLWPHMQDEGSRLAVLLMRIMAPALVAFSLSVMPELTLHSYKEFTIPAVAEAAFRFLVLISLVVLVGLVWKPGDANGILAAGLGVVIGGVARLVVQLPSFKKRWRVPSLGKTFRQVGAEAIALPMQLIRYPHQPVLWIGGLTLCVALTICIAKWDWLLAGQWLLYGVGIAAVTGALYGLSRLVRKGGEEAEISADRNPDMPRLWGLIPPIIVGLTFSTLRTYIDSYCGTAIEEGAYSCLDYARRLPDTMAQILPMAVSFVVYPFLSEWAHRGEKDKLGDALVQTTRIIAFIFIPATVWMIVLRWGVLWLVYGGGEFTPEKQNLSILALLAYTPGMAFFSIEGILNKWYFALNDTKTPNYVGSACAILHVFIAVMGVFQLNLGVLAVALALTISKSLKVIILYALLRGRIGKVKWGPVGTFAVKLAVACGVMAAATYFAADLVEQRIELAGRGTAFVYLTATSLVAVPVFLIGAFVLRIEETRMVLSHVTKRIRRRSA